MHQWHCGKHSVAAVVMAMLAVLATFAAVPSQLADAGPVSGKAQSFLYGSGPASHPYIVYTPRGWTANRQLPLIVMLHGCQTSAYQQMKASLYNPLADRMGFVVVYPDTDAAENSEPGPLSRCWNFYLRQDSRRGQGDGAVVARITRQVMKRWDIDRQRVYVMGMSAGAFLSANLAAEYPDLYAASGENAGGAYADPGCLLGGAGLPVASTAALAVAEMGRRARVVPRIVLGGDADTGVTPGCADNALLQSLRTNNLVIDGQQTEPIQLNPASTQSEQVPGGYSYLVSDYVDNHGCLIGQRYLIHGMNHFWSGGSSNPKWADFTDPKGPSAAVASWQFLSRFTLNNTQRPCRTSGSASVQPSGTTSRALHLADRRPIMRGALTVVRRSSVCFMILDLNCLHLQPKIPTELLGRPTHTRLRASTPAPALTDVLSEVRNDSHCSLSGRFGMYRSPPWPKTTARARPHTSTALHSQPWVSAERAVSSCRRLAMFCTFTSARSYRSNAPGETYGGCSDRTDSLPLESDWAMQRTPDHHLSPFVTAGHALRVAESQCLGCRCIVPQVLGDLTRPEGKVVRTHRNDDSTCSTWASKRGFCAGRPTHRNLATGHLVAIGCRMYALGSERLARGRRRSSARAARRHRTTAHPQSANGHSKQ